MGQPSLPGFASTVENEALTEERIRSLKLENQIACAFLLFSIAATPKQRRKTWSRFSRLCAQRSPEQIARMERERGLTA